MPASASEPLVDLKGVRFGHGSRMIFDGVDLSIRRGEVVALIGSSGVGKTTLLRLIGGQIRAMKGHVRVAGVNVGELDRKGLFALRRRMGMLFQQGALFTDLSVFENVAFPYRENTALSDALIRTLVLMKLQTVGLRGAAEVMPSELSGGMARRVALARAIALDPMLMMYDEPFTGLDPISVGMIGRLIRRINDAFGMTSIVVTHDLNESLLIADRVVLLAEKRVYADLTPAELRSTQDPFVRQFADGAFEGPVPFHYPAPPLVEDLYRAAPRS